MPMACVLVSDVTDSTGLYDRLADVAALARIEPVLARMRHLVDAAGGHSVKSKGDDVLSFFGDADAAFAAARTMVVEPWPEGLGVHAGAYYGEILNHADDIYGNAVNTASRLAQLAKDGEILFGDACHDRLSPTHRLRFLAIGAIPLRGKEVATRVYSCIPNALGDQTTVMPGRHHGPRQTAFAALTCGGRRWQLAPGDRLRIGRALDCDVVINLPSVSRSHGALAIMDGALEYTDHSSAGSLVRAVGRDLAVHRRTTLLSGEGTIVIGRSPAPGDANVIAYRTGVLHRR